MSTQSIQKTRKTFAIALLVVIVWFGITGVMGPLFGKLSSVQENNNSSFLPKGAEATKAADVIATFSSKDSFNFPTLILFEGISTPETFAAINAHISKVGALTLDGTSAKISDFLAPGQQVTVFPSQDGKAILANIPLDGNAISKVLVYVFCSKGIDFRAIWLRIFSISVRRLVICPFNSPGASQVPWRFVLRLIWAGEVTSADSSMTQPISRSGPIIGATHSSFRLF